MAGPCAYIAVNGAKKAIEFYKNVFDATEVMMMEHGGKVGHAEIRIGGRSLYLADEYPDMGFKAPKAFGGSPVMIHLYVENVDAVFERAVKMGAKSMNAPEDQFYGDRGGKFEDPFGYTWWVATHKEELSMDELKKRSKAKFGA